MVVVVVTVATMVMFTVLLGKETKRGTLAAATDNRGRLQTLQGSAYVPVFPMCAGRVDRSWRLGSHPGSFPGPRH